MVRMIAPMQGGPMLGTDGDVDLQVPGQHHTDLKNGMTVLPRADTGQPHQCLLQVALVLGHGADEATYFRQPG